ncbi:MAG: DUF2541 family protein [Crocinitomix sp.]|nr:DUF2541 family protein [Crocinitomix sp.]
MKALKILGLTFALVFSTVAMSNVVAKEVAAPGAWEKLGVKKVDLKADHDVLVVSFHEGFYSKVKFVIRKAPLHLTNVNIVFGNGENKNIIFNKRFAAGSTTRIIDLPGNKRIIKKIKMNYKTIPSGTGRAIFVAWGKH